MITKQQELTFAQLIERLDGLTWFALSGFAVYMYTNGKRQFGDIDLAVMGKDIHTFAERMGCVVQKRVIDKKTFVVEDYGFEIEFNGLKIEVSSGYPMKRMNECTFNKLFAKRKSMQYLGKEVFVCPIEELLVQKSFMHREKDIEDIKLLAGRNIDLALVRELANDWGKSGETLKTLNLSGIKA